jgi:hypothetical protein
MTLHLALESTLIKTINKPFIVVLFKVPTSLLKTINKPFIVVDFKAPTHLSLYFDLSVIYCSNLNRQIFVYHIFIESIQHFPTIIWYFQTFLVCFALY